MTLQKLKTLKTSNQGRKLHSNIFFSLFSEKPSHPNEAFYGRQLSNASLISPEPKVLKQDLEI